MAVAKPDTGHAKYTAAGSSAPRVKWELVGNGKIVLLRLFAFGRYDRTLGLLHHSRGDERFPEAHICLNHVKVKTFGSRQLAGSSQIAIPERLRLTKI